MARMDELFGLMVDKGCSDLHYCIDSPPHVPLQR